MTKKQSLIEEFFENAGFRDRIIIGLYEGKRIYFHVDFTEELASGLISMALMDENIHQGLKQLKYNLERIINAVEEIKPDEHAIH